MPSSNEETLSRDDVSEDRTAAPPSAEQAPALERVLDILDCYMADLQAGRSTDRSRLLAAHPDLAQILEGCLPGIEFIHGTVGNADGQPAALGDFRIIREVGRGGMGVVYEAEQISLRRTVALKILKYGALADETALLRFRREAETVAQLHHTNIVPLYTVGSEGGVHYFAMQFIEGRSLAVLLAETREHYKLLAPTDVADWGRQAAGE
jgi:serine/threonine protein kinase